MKRNIFFSLIFFFGCARSSPFEMISLWEMVDLTHTLEEGIPYFPGGKEVKVEILKSLEKDGYYMRQLHITEHTSTHIDAPSHFLREGANSDEILPKELCGRGVVIDISSQSQGNPDYVLSITDVEEWEAKYGLIKRGDIVLVHTGWSRFWKEPEKYLNRGKDGKLHFPGVSKDACELIIKGRKAKAIGIDTLSLDAGISEEFEAHRVVLGYGKYIVENLNGLERGIGRDLFLCVFPLKIKGGSGSPVRVIGWMR